MSQENQELQHGHTAYRLLLSGDYDQAIAEYRQAIAVEPHQRSHYWYLGLGLLLSGHEEEAQLTWLTALGNADSSQLDGWTTELVTCLETEAQRQEECSNYSQALLLRQHLRELDSLNSDNLLHLMRLSRRYDSLVVAPNAAIPLNIDDSSAMAALEGIPSDTTPSERCFLYRFFATIWSGTHHVCEIGPFLGGTTRSIALGMLANPKRQNSCKLYTYDRFNQYYSSNELLAIVEPLFTHGLLEESYRQAVQASDCFMPLFQHLHHAQPYSDWLVAVESTLPNIPEEIPDLANLFQIDSSLKFDAVFVDGCKSWYGTKYFMQVICQHTSPGCYYIFQDYGWYTCFWISAFLAIMKQFFQLVAYIDSTYVFQLVKPLDADQISSLYPDTPHSLGTSELAEIFSDLLMGAAIRNDLASIVFHNIHYASALAYIGHPDQAKMRLANLAKQPWARDYQHWIQAALTSPTYWPNGDPIYL